MSGKEDPPLNKLIESIEWGTFKLGEIFEFKAIKQAKSQKIIPTDDTDSGVPYIVQSMSNNMFSRNVNKQWLIDNNEHPVSGNKIVLGVTLPAVSYQPREFGASQVITASADWLNENNGLFIATIISKLMYQFSYQNKPGLEIYKNLSINLPIKNEKIDFDFMETFISQLEAKRVEQLESYLIEHDLVDYDLTAEELNALQKFDDLKWDYFNLKDLFGKA